MSHKLFTAAAASAAVLGGAYLLSIRGRSDHPGMKDLQNWNYAHRGLHGNGLPENSMAAFRAALEHGYGIELDIHLMKDGNLAVIHDCSLKRTAGEDVKITDLTVEDLEHYRLEGTGERIPLFSQVLELFAGKAPLIIELKADGNNHKALVDTAMKAMEGYEGPWCMESFDPRCIRDLKQSYPHVIRGILTTNYFGGGSTLPAPMKFVLQHNLLNFLICPDFIAYDFKHRKSTPSNFLCKQVWGVQGVCWTLRNQEDYNTATKEGWLPIFEHFEP